MSRRLRRSAKSAGVSAGLQKQFAPPRKLRPDPAAPMKKARNNIVPRNKRPMHSELRNSARGRKRPLSSTTCPRGPDAACATVPTEVESNILKQNSPQRPAIEDSSNAAARRLSAWGIPDSIRQGFADVGVGELYPWQAQCLEEHPEVLQGSRHFIYTAPTSGGKTLIAEILLIRRILSLRCKALFVLPYNSVVAEKTQYLKMVLRTHNAHVKGSRIGVRDISKMSLARWMQCRAKVGLCTIEKANKLINFCLDNDSMKNIGLVIVDEFHMVHDKSRGGTLESLVSKVLYYNSAPEIQTPSSNSNFTKTHGKRCHFIQIVGLSATLSSLPKLQTWLGASSFQSTFRPVSLSHFVILQGAIWQVRARSNEASITPAPPSSTLNSLLCIRDHEVQKIRDLGSIFASRPCCQQMQHTLKRQHLLKETHIAFLCHEILFNGPSNFLISCVSCAREHTASPSCTEHQRASSQGCQQILVFCGQRAACERTATLVRKALQKYSACFPNAGKYIRRMRLSLVERWKKVTGHISNEMRASLLCGIACHHAGYTVERRRLIENWYRQGFLSILFATSTLAVGVNLPATRVIFDGVSVGGKGNFLDNTRYMQMAGRAGRSGMRNVTSGDSYIVLNDNANGMHKVPSLFESVSPDGSSSLMNDVVRGEKQKTTSDVTQGGRATLISMHATTLRKLVLEVICTGLVSSTMQLRTFTRNLLGCALEPSRTVEIETAALHCVDELEAEKCLSKKSTTCESGGVSKVNKLKTSIEDGPIEITPTPIGRALVLSNIPPEIGPQVYARIQVACMQFDISSDFHIAYLLVPYDMPFPYWKLSEHFLEAYQRLSVPERQLFQRLGLSVERLRSWQHHGGCTAKQWEYAGSSYKYFYLGLVLRDIVSEVPVRSVSSRFYLEPGYVQELQSRSVAFAGTVASFCHQMKWKVILRLVTRMYHRLKHGVGQDIIPLMKLGTNILSPVMARALFQAGVQTIDRLAVTPTQEVERIFVLATPFAPNQVNEESTHYRARLKAKAQEISQLARRIMQGRQKRSEARLKQLAHEFGFPRQSTELRVIDTKELKVSSSSPDIGDINNSCDSIDEDWDSSHTDSDSDDSSDSMDADDLDFDCREHMQLKTYDFADFAASGIGSPSVSSATCGRDSNFRDAYTRSLSASQNASTGSLWNASDGATFPSSGASQPKYLLADFREMDTGSGLNAANANHASYICGEDIDGLVSASPVSFGVHNELIPNQLWQREDSMKATSATNRVEFGSWKLRVANQRGVSCFTCSLPQGRQFVGGIAVAGDNNVAVYIQFPRPLPIPIVNTTELAWASNYVERVMGFDHHGTNSRPHCFCNRSAVSGTVIPVHSSVVSSSFHRVWMLILQFADFFPRRNGHSPSRPDWRIASVSQDLAVCYYAARSLAFQLHVEKITTALYRVTHRNQPRAEFCVHGLHSLSPSARTLVVLDRGLESRSRFYLGLVSRSAEASAGCPLRCGLFDLSVAVWLLDPKLMVERVKALKSAIIKLKKSLSPEEAEFRSRRLYSGVEYLGHLVASYVPVNRMLRSPPGIQNILVAAEHKKSTLQLRRRGTYWRGVDRTCAEVGAKQLLQLFLTRALKRARLFDHFCNVEMPIGHVLLDMESAGIGIDRNMLAQVSRRISDKLVAIQRFVETAAKTFENNAAVCRKYGLTTGGDAPSKTSLFKLDLLAPRHLLFVATHLLKLSLRQEDGLVVADLTSSYCAPGHPESLQGLSTSRFKVVTRSVAHNAIAALVVEFHSLHSMKRKWIQKLLRCAKYDSAMKMFRCHPTFSQLSQTGRVMCLNPNLQATPKDPMVFWPAHKVSLNEEWTSIPSPFCDDALGPGDAKRRAEVVSINKSKVLHDDSAWTRNSFVCTSLARIDRVFGTTFCSESIRHVRTLTQSTNSNTHGVSPPLLVQSLAEYWAQNGFPYAAREASVIPQVLVRFPRKARHTQNNEDRSDEEDVLRLTYPADKIFRLDAEVRISDKESSSFRQHSSGDAAVHCADVHANKPNDKSGGDVEHDGSKYRDVYPTNWPCHKIEFSIRDFVVAAQGCVLLSVDFSQIEMRLLAHFSKDSSLIQSFQSGVDVFRLIAARFVDLQKRSDRNFRPTKAVGAALSSKTCTNQAGVSTPLNSVTSKQRTMAKQLCYSMLYGSGDATIAAKLGVSVSRAKSARSIFAKAFPTVVQFRNQVIDNCRRSGFVETITGRRRYLPNINSTNPSERNEAERQAVNTLCQASAADIMKNAMLDMDDALRDFNSATRLMYGRLAAPARMVLQIHDEVLVEVDARVAEKLVPVARAAMIGISSHNAEASHNPLPDVAQSGFQSQRLGSKRTRAQLNVPLAVTFQIGRRWGSLEDFRDTVRSRGTN